MKQLNHLQFGKHWLYHAPLSNLLSFHSNIHFPSTRVVPLLQLEFEEPPRLLTLSDTGAVVAIRTFAATGIVVRKPSSATAVVHSLCCVAAIISASFRDLSSNLLKGVIPSSIGNLSHLQVLHKKEEALLKMAEKLAPEKRHSFVHDGQTVFEWDQTLDEVNIYINLPPNVHSKQFYCNIQSKHIQLGIKGNPPYLNHDLTCPVKTDSSFWTIEDDIMHITLQKRDKGQTWASPILGQGQLDPYSTDLEQKRLMLQRFQEENPGFDFSQAQFSGNCPNPRTFMGGIRSD